jgi:alkylation response protein AidB-like acyl-CoA dehydrogenase
MHFAFTAEQQQLRDAVRDLLAKECPPSAVRAAWTNENGRVPGLWTHLADLGVVGLTAAEAQGGLGLSEIDLALILEETGRFGVPEPIVETTAVGIPLLQEAGRLDVVAQAAAGKASLALGFDTWPIVAGAAAADDTIVPVDGALHLVPRDALKLTAEVSVDGARRVHRVEVVTSAKTRLDVGSAARELAFDRAAFATSAQLLGVARQLIDMTVAYVKVREQFQKPVGSFQAVKHHLANAFVKLDFARPLVYRAAWSLARGLPDRSLHVSMAKSQASDAAFVASRVALQCHGAIGYAPEHDLHLWMKRAWALGAAWGGPAWHRRRVERAIFARAGGT